MPSSIVGKVSGDNGKIHLKCLLYVEYDSSFVCFSRQISVPIKDLWLYPLERGFRHLLTS